MEKIFALLSIALISIAPVYAAEEPTEAGAKVTTVITGQAVDAETLEGEPFATYQIFKGNRENKPVVITITDVNGYFAETISGKGDFTLQLTSLGRKDIVRKFHIDGSVDTLALGKLLFENDTETLASSTVTALKPLVKMDVDKMTYDVENDVDSKSYTVLDMLRKVPMVTVDGQDNISVNGSSNFQVLVDGKPNVMLSSNPSVVFKSMPASAVKNIEVITNPGVKYDAEGVGGVLNITMARNADGSKAASMDGYNATVGANVSTRGFGGRLFATAQKGKLSLSANANVMDMTIKGNDSESVRTQLDQMGNAVSINKTTSTSEMKNPINMVSLTLGYEIDKLRLVSVNFGYMSLANKNISDMMTELTRGNAVDSYSSKTNTRWDMGSINAGIDYQRTFDGKPDKMLTISYRFDSQPSVTDSKSIFTTTSDLFDFTNRYTDGGTNTIANTFQIDFTTPLAKGLNMNTGAKFINRNNSSDQSLYLDDNGSWAYNKAGSMDYSHVSNIVAGYAEFTLSLNKWGFKVGTRYEHTFQDVKYRLGNGDDFSLDYGNFVPAASIQYNLSMLSNIGLSYNMRISRPGITYLNPYVDTTDPTSWSYGNTDLDTETAHNINLVYNFYNPTVMLNATLRHTFSNDGISQYSFFDADNVLNTTYGNILKSSTTGINIFANLNLGKKTRIMLNSSVSYSDLRSDERGLSNYGWSSNIFGGIQQTLPWDLRLSLNGMYATSNVSLDGSRTGMSLAMGGLTKTFLNDRLSIGINGVLPISSELGKMVMESNTAGKDYINYSKNTINMGQITLNISFTFGKNKAAGAKKTRKTISNDDLIDRSNGTEEMNSYMNM
ncbi:MAG: TonB-dependent receptor [Bacteroidales bacterium]|nr:TonB-dependent receptor [Bacteroidales bacterium]